LDGRVRVQKKKGEYAARRAIFVETEPVDEKTVDPGLIILASLDELRELFISPHIYPMLHIASLQAVSFF
jgi:hypothetical protein